MIKIFMLFINLISFNFYSVSEKKEILLTPYEEIEENVIDVIDNYKIIYENDTYIVLNGERRIECSSKPTLKRIGEVIYIAFYEKDNLRLFLYNIYGEMIEQRLLFDFCGEFNFEVINNEIYLIGTSNFNTNEESKKQSNLVLYNIETKESKYYGGIKNEKYLFSGVNEDKLYVCFYKDAITYGDFGNGGVGEENITIAIISTETGVEKYLVLDLKEEVKDFKINENIIVETTNTIVSLTKELMIINSFPKEDIIIKTYIGYDKVYLFYRDEIIVLNSDNLFEYDKILFDLNGKEILEYDNILLLKDGNLNYFDIIDYSEWQCFDRYYKDENLDTINTIYGKAEFIEKKPLSYFNENIFGEYEFNVHYKTKIGVDFEIYLKQVIVEEFNVIEGMTYPLGYRLIFNGNAYLDGKAIVNNYPVNTVGNHKLIIHGNDVEKEINFNISDCSLVYNDIIYINEDVIFNVGERVFFDYVLSDYPIDINIKEVVCNRDVIDFYLEENILHIEFKKYESCCKDTIYIEKIIYELYGIDGEININSRYDVLIKNKNIAMNIGGLKNNTINFEALECVGLIRGIKLMFVDSSGKCYEYVSIGDNIGKDILIRGIRPGEYELSINVLKYNVNGYQSIELCKGDFIVSENSFTFGKLICYQDANREVLTVKIDDNILKCYDNLFINNQKVFESDRIDYKKLIIIGVCCSIVLFTFSRIIKRKHFKKTKQNM